MLSALRNFALTFAISAVIFGLIAFFISDPIMNAAGSLGSSDKDDEESSLEIETEPGTPGVTPNNPVNDRPDTNDLSGSSFNILFIGSDYTETLKNQFDGKSYAEALEHPEYGEGLHLPDYATDTYRKLFTRKRQVDSLILLRVDKETGRYVFCSIPTNIRFIRNGEFIELRELLGSISDSEPEKTYINYVSAYTGVDIDYYFHLNLDQFPKFLQSIVDKTGIKFSYTCPYDMKDEDNGLNIDFKGGKTQIDTPEEALQMLRYNGYTSAKQSRGKTAIGFMQYLLGRYTESLSGCIALYEHLIQFDGELFETNIDDKEFISNNQDMILKYNKFTPVEVTYPGVEKKYDSAEAAIREKKGLSTTYFEPALEQAVSLLG